MDPESLAALGRRFWYAWATAMAVGAVVVVGAAAVVAPDDAWLVALCGVLCVGAVGFGVVSLAQDDRLDALGTWVAASGWGVWAVGAAGAFSDSSFWGGWWLLVGGAALGLWADHGHRIRAAVGG